MKRAGTRRIASVLCLTVGGAGGVGCQLLAGFQSFSGGASDGSAADGVGGEASDGTVPAEAAVDDASDGSAADGVGGEASDGTVPAEAAVDDAGGPTDCDAATGCIPTAVPEAQTLVLWLDGANGWDGTTWHDRSGNGRDAKMYAPIVSSTTLNGLPAVTFAGGALLIDTGFPAWTGATAFAVQWTQQSNALISFGVSFNSLPCDMYPPSGAADCVPYDQLAFGGYGAFGVAMCDPAIGTCYKVFDVDPPDAWVRTYAEEIPDATIGVRTWLNGSENVGLTHSPAYPYPPPWNTPRADTILGWANYRGSVAEIIVFNAPLSGASCQAIDAYLANKWNVH